MLYSRYTKRFLSLVLFVGLFFFTGCTKTVMPATTETITNTPPSPSVTGQNIPVQDLPVVNTPEEKVIERQTYKSKTDGFIIQFPITRTFQENVYGSSVMFYSPVSETDKIKENVGIMKKTLDKAYSLTEYYEITKPGLIKLIPGFTEISNQSIKINDIDAQKLIYIGTQGTTKLKWEQVYLIKNQTVYIISYTATEATFNDYAQKVDEMVSTLEIQ